MHIYCVKINILSNHFIKIQNQLSQQAFQSTYNLKAVVVTQRNKRKDIHELFSCKENIHSNKKQTKMTS